MLQKSLFIVFIIGLLSFTIDTQSFKSDQQQFSRVRQGYVDKEQNIKQNLSEKGLDLTHIAAIVTKKIVFQ